MARRYGLMSYVYKRGDSGILELRFPIPILLRRHFPKPSGKGVRTHIIKSLGTKDKGEANRLALPLVDGLHQKLNWLSGEIDDRVIKELLRKAYVKRLKMDVEWRENYRVEELIHDKTHENVRRLPDPALKGLEVDLTYDLAKLDAIGMPPPDFEDIQLFLEYAEHSSGELRQEAIDWFLADALKSLAIEELEFAADDAVGRRLAALGAETLREVLRTQMVRSLGEDAPVEPRADYLRANSPAQVYRDPDANRGKTPTGRLLLPEFLEAHLKAISSRQTPLDPLTVKKRRAAWKKFVEWFPDGTQACDVTIPEMWEFAEALRDLPNRAGVTRELKSLTFRRQVELFREKPDRFTLRATATLQADLGQVKTVFAWADARDHILFDPAVKISIDAGEESAGVRPFTIDELNALFRHEVFVGPDALSRDDIFWVPLLQLFTGCRLAELAVTTKHIHIGQHCASSYLDVEAQEDRRLKTPGSRRIVPIHPELVRLGFVEYCERVMESGATMLFPAWERPMRSGVPGRYSTSPRRRDFNGKVLPEAGVKFPDTDSRSFRKNYENLITEGGLPDRIARRLQGRVESSSAKHYISDKLDPKPLYEQLSSVQYSGLELAHQYPKGELRSSDS